ncbi:hypothetical protein AURDEDRAFT_80006 [Auricularia subglabra TFB-10046 SS5]|nr:hypothetical protein AURDEDRAFT_80006 [Auricularia subglabra TFB-10046 SS5]
MDSGNFFKTLASHPVFAPAEDPSSSTMTLLSLSQSQAGGEGGATRPKRVMCVREADIILAAGAQLRMVPVQGDLASKKSYNALDAPDLGFAVYQLLPSPNGKLLAVAGLHQVVVVVLPRPGYWKSESQRVAVKSLTLGERHHKRKGSPRVVKLDWHSWGEHGATLLVGTADGVVREYDASQNPDEPQQTISFMPPQTRKTFLADASTRELVSFTLGGGNADWGPLTLYGLMKNGDVYAIAPYMPARAAVPPSYLWSLQYYVQEKLEAAHRRPGFAALYEQQLKYVTALTSQLPPQKVLANAKPAVVAAPPPARFHVARQGPFLLQPEPHELAGSVSDDAVDIMYVGLQLKNVEKDSEAPAEQLGVILISWQDGKIDICLDLDKVEARWEHGQVPSDELPLFTVFETIDLGLIPALNKAGMNSFEDVLSANFPLFHIDPLYNDTIYVYHSFGVHCLLLRRWVNMLLGALHGEDKGEDAARVESSVEKARGTDAFCILDSFSPSEKSSVPIIGVALPNNVYLPYSLLTVTSSMQCSSFELALRVDSSQPPLRESVRGSAESPSTSSAPPGKQPYVSSLQPWSVPAVFVRPGGLPSAPRIALPNLGPAGSKELQVNPETLRLLASTVEKFRGELAQIGSGVHDVRARVELQRIEQARQVAKTLELSDAILRLRSAGAKRVRDRLEGVVARQQELLGRLDRTVQAYMDAACPNLSEHETRWFEELKRMHKQVSGADDGRTLLGRADSLENRLEQLRPGLQLLAKKKQQKAPAPMGSSQALRVGRRLGDESRQIEELTSKLKDLCVRVGIPQPPAASA